MKIRLIALLLLAQIAACQTVSPTRPGPATQPTAQPASPSVSASPVASASASTGVIGLSAYMMRTQQRFEVQGFRTQAINATHEALLKQAVSQFEQDMTQNNTDAYFQNPSFSIKLLAGSEGSYFQSPDLLASLTGYAMALVVYPDQSSDIFKGNLVDSVFYFTGADSLPEQNTTYLIALDGSLKSQVFSGSLTPFSIQSEASASASPTASPTATPTPTPLPSPSMLQFSTSPPPPANYQQALEAARQRAGELQARRFRPEPPPPPRPGQTGSQPPPPPRPDGLPPTGNPPPINGNGNGAAPPQHPYPDQALMERLRKDRPELAKAFEDLAGLAPNEHYQRALQLYEANKDILTPPPAPPEEKRP